MKNLIFLVLLICPFILGQAGNPIPRRVDSLFTKTSDIVNVKGFGAEGDGTTDDTQALQDAIDYAGTYGGEIVSDGEYRITSTLRIIQGLVWEGNGANWTEGQAGTTILVDIDDKFSPGIYILGGFSEGINYVVLKNMRITSGVASWHGGSDLISDNIIGIKIDQYHYGKLENLIVDGFDSCGVLLYQSYYWDIQNCYFGYNNIGILDDGSKAYVVMGCHAQYNNIGFRNIDNIIGGSTQGQWFDGIYLGGNIGYRASITNHYFEANNSSESWGRADIRGDSIYYGELSLNGSVYFASDYSGSSQPTHNIKGKFAPLVVYGTTYFTANPWYNFRFNGNTAIYDYGANPMDDPGNNTLNYTNVEYNRPTMKPYSSLKYSALGSSDKPYEYAYINYLNIGNPNDTTQNTEITFDGENLIIDKPLVPIDSAETSWGSTNNPFRTVYTDSVISNLKLYLRAPLGVEIIGTLQLKPQLNVLVTDDDSSLIVASNIIELDPASAVEFDTLYASPDLYNLAGLEITIYNESINPVTFKDNDGGNWVNCMRLTDDVVLGQFDSFKLIYYVNLQLWIQSGAFIDNN